MDAPLAKFETIQQQELEHFLILKEALEQVGGDPTEQTPCADVTAVASSGLLQTVSDPRTNLAQCLSAALTAELTDNAAWELLIELCERAGVPKVARRFGEALEHEAEHLLVVKSLLRELTLKVADAHDA